MHGDPVVRPGPVYRRAGCARAPRGGERRASRRQGDDQDNRSDESRYVHRRFDAVSYAEVHARPGVRTCSRSRQPVIGTTTTSAAGLDGRLMSSPWSRPTGCSSSCERRAPMRISGKGAPRGSPSRPARSTRSTRPSRSTGSTARCHPRDRACPSPPGDPRPDVERARRPDRAVDGRGRATPRGRRAAPGRAGLRPRRPQRDALLVRCVA